MGLSRLLMALVLPMLLVSAASGCAPFATLNHADGTTIRGKLVHDDDDIVVMRRVILKAPRSEPAPWSDRRGRRAWVQRTPELAVPWEEVRHLTVQNRPAFKAGLAGSIITGVSLFILVPSALSLDERGLDGNLAEVGTVFGSVALTAGLVTAILGWSLYADSYRSVPGPAAPVGSEIVP